MGTVRGVTKCVWVWQAVLLGGWRLALGLHAMQAFSDCLPPQPTSYLGTLPLHHAPCLPPCPPHTAHRSQPLPPLPWPPATRAGADQRDPRRRGDGPQGHRYRRRPRQPAERGAGESGQGMQTGGTVEHSLGSSMQQLGSSMQQQLPTHPTRRPAPTRSTPPRMATTLRWRVPAPTPTPCRETAPWPAPSPQCRWGGWGGGLRLGCGSWGRRWGELRAGQGVPLVRASTTPLQQWPPLSPPPQVPATPAAAW